jgi:beta-glucosidase
MKSPVRPLRTLPALLLLLAHPALAAPLSDAEVEARVERLLARMTVEEKVGQLNQIAGGLFPGIKPEESLKSGAAGSVLWLNETKRFNELQKVAVEQSRLGIPVLYGLDVIHGYRTIFPVPLGLAASWDPSLHERAAAVAAREARAAGVHWTFAPMVDIARDARWGRIVEGAGEDPYLGAAMAAAQVRGFQGPALGTAERLLACAKHFAAYGAAPGGRDYDSVSVPESDMRNVYLPPFQAAVEAGVGSFMSAYMDLNDVPAGANRWLLRSVLKGEWAFPGFVVSDAFGVGNLVTQRFARDRRDAAVRSVLAGLDMEMASGAFAETLAGAVRDGAVPMAELDDAVRRVLGVKVRLGLFEQPYADETRVASVLADPAHRALAREAARRSFVLLRNEGKLLPLSKTPGRLAVIGPLADSKADTEGAWMVFGHVPAAVTVLEGIKARVPAAQVAYAPGPEIRRAVPSMFEEFVPGPKKAPQTAAEAEAAFRAALAAARSADVVVAVMGELASMNGEAASRSSLDLPGRQQELLEAVVGLGKPVVLVLVSGRPLAVGWAAENVPAILEAWHPGSEGGHAVADVLFGDAVPGGKLPVTFPRSVGQAPLFLGHNTSHQPPGSRMYRSRYWEGSDAPLYPFGFGLSYTTFSYAGLEADASEIRVGGTVNVSVDVTNTGTVAGDEVVQLYLHQKSGSASRPVRELKGFRRVTLAPGATQTVTFALGPRERRYWSTAEGRYVEEAAEFDVWAGGDSTASLHASFAVTR